MGSGLIQIDPVDGGGMERLLERRVVEVSIGVVVALLALTPLVSYALWISDGCEPNLPFISDMDLPRRSGLSFTIGYALSGVLLALTGLQLGVLRRVWIAEAGLPDSWGHLNSVSMAAAIAAGIGLFWISFTPWNEHFELHIFQANVIFFGSAIWALGMTLGTWRMALEDSAFSDFLIPRSIFTGMGLVGLIGMIERFIRFTGLSTDLYALEERLGMLNQDCTSMKEGLLSQAAAFEWMLAGSMILVLASLLPEIKLLTRD